MTPSFLQDALVDELRRLFHGKVFRNANGQETALKIFKQQVPLTPYGEDNAADMMPYLVVSLDGWKQATPTDAVVCNVDIIAAVFDDREDRQGYKDLLNIMEDIYLHLRTHSVIDKRFRLQHPIEAVLSTEDTFPFFFGMIETSYLLLNVYGNPEGDDNV